MPDAPQAGAMKKTEMVFNNETLCRLEVPSSIDLNVEWRKFQKDHNHVSDKKGAFPSMFCGDLVNKLGCKQLDASTKCDGKAEFKI